MNDNNVLPCICEGCKVPKGWGEELIIENNEMYCGKLLIFKSGCKFSMHYHMKKDETWYVHSGTYIYRYIDVLNANVIEMRLEPGDIVRQKPGLPHQLIAETDGTIFEVSTHHEDSDSYRIWKGNSQK